MQTFHYLPPGPEEQRGFVMQFVGTLAGLALIAALWWWAHDPAMKGVLLGAAVGTIFLLAKGAWQLELKAQRSQHAEVGVGDEGLSITDARGQTQSVKWQDVVDCRVVYSRLTIVWPGGQIAIGAREMQDGMVLVQEVTRQWIKHTRGEDEPPAVSNFIPLTPR